MSKLFIFLALLAVTFAPTIPAEAAETTNDTFYCRLDPGKDAQGRQKPERCVIAEKEGACDNLPPINNVKWTESTDSCKCGDDPKKGDECVQLENPLASEETDIAGLIGAAIKAALGVVGAVTLLIFFMGANTWIMAAGNTEKISSGSKTMLWAAIGLLAVLASYVVVGILIQFITGTGLGA